MNKSVVMFFSGLVCLAVGAADYYVKSDGNDANDGTSLATARATIAGGLALLGGQNDRLLVDEGRYVLTEPVVLSNNIAMVSLKGAEKTTIVPSGDNNFAMALVKDADSVIDGFTFDFYIKSKSRRADGFPNMAGKLLNCKIVNFRIGDQYSTGRECKTLTCTSGTPVVSNCTFQACLARYNESKVIDSAGAALALIGCSFVDCDVDKFFVRATVYVKLSPGNMKSVVRNCLFLRCHVNECHEKNVPYILRGDSTVEIANCSFVDCVFHDADGEYVDGQVVGGGGTVCNCLIQNCRTDDGALRTGGGPWNHCAADFAMAGEGCIDTRNTAFRFRDPTNDDYRVVAGPTINAGTNLTWMAGAKDLSGEVDRIVNAVVDIGCYECNLKGLLLLVR